MNKHRVSHPYAVMVFFNKEQRKFLKNAGASKFLRKCVDKAMRK